MSDPLRIVIVGGVAGGASAATRARRINEHARIILLEKDEYVSFANCGLPYYIGGEIADRDKLLVAKPKMFRQFFNIDVRTRHEALAIDRTAHRLRVRDHHHDRDYELPYDKLILATGAEPIRPPIEGIDASNVFTLRNMADADHIKSYIEQRKPRRAVVVGAGFIGLEMVEMLCRLDLTVALVELQPQILPPLDAEMAHIIQAELERHAVQLYLNKGLQALRLAESPAAERHEYADETPACDPSGSGHVESVVLDDGTTIDTDLVIVGIGVRPNTRLAVEAGLALGQSQAIAVNDFMQTSDPDIYAVGDVCEYRHEPAGIRTRIALAGPANKAGRVAGEHAACGAAPTMSAVLGTAIVRVFETVGGVTGLTEKTARQHAFDYTAAWVDGRHHAGYYPGSKAMWLKLIFENGSGRILGLQAVGGAGVDKRIDVIATLIAMHGTVADLSGLDLAYAPPFGNARDPLHQVAYVAENHLRELNRIVPPDATASPDDIQWLDVRSVREWQAGHLDNAILIPLPELRRRHGELDKGRPIVTICHAGKRAHYATRILRQLGYADVGTLAVGMQMQQHA